MIWWWRDTSRVRLPVSRSHPLSADPLHAKLTCRSVNPAPCFTISITSNLLDFVQNFHFVQIWHDRKRVCGLRRSDLLSWWCILSQKDLPRIQSNTSHWGDSKVYQWNNHLTNSSVWHRGRLCIMLWENITLYLQTIPQHEMLSAPRVFQTC